MTGAGLSAVVPEEIRKADEELRAAETLLAAEIPRVALTRAYFAVFHMARALLYVEGHEPKSHEGVLRLVGLLFVKSGKVTVADSRSLARLQKYRGEADYGDAVVVDRASAEEDVASARAVCDRLRVLIPVDLRA